MPLAELFLTIAATVAFPARIHKAPDARQITDGESLDLGPGVHDTADYLVTWNDGIHRAAPFVAGRMNVAMTDAAVGYIDDHVVSARLATLE